MLVALGSIYVNKYNSNKKTAQAIKQILYYCSTHPDVTIRYKEGNLVLRIHSYGSYLSGS